MNRARVLESFLRSNADLGGQSAVRRVDRRAYDRRVLRFDQYLPADNHKRPLPFRIVLTRFLDQEDIAACHWSAWNSRTSNASSLSSSACSLMRSNSRLSRASRCRWRRYRHVASSMNADRFDWSVSAAIALRSSSDKVTEVFTFIPPIYHRPSDYAKVPPVVPACCLSGSVRQDQIVGVHPNVGIGV